MDARQQAATIMALEAATDAMMSALRRRPDPDLEAATIALKARENAIRLLAGSDPNTRPPDMIGRIRRVLECDREAADQLRAEMDSLRVRLASTRQMMHEYRTANRPDSRAAGSRTADARVPERVR
jgi:hypothetical protein